MKKLISILLVAMLILGMFPATALTAFAADTYEKATSISVGDTVILVCESKSMEMKTIGSQKYGEGQSYSGTPTGLVPLIVEEGYTSGTYSFKAPAGTYLYWTSGNYLQLNGTKSANTSWTVEFSGENAVIKNANDSSRQIQWNASSPRFSTYTSAQTAIQLYKLSTGATEPEQPDVPACEHTETVAIGEAKEATCTEAGTTAGEKCAACDEVIEAQKEIPALGHNYADGTCSRCGAEQPVVTEESYTFSSFPAGTQYAENEEHKLSDIVTMYTTKCHFTSELRIYSSSTNDGYAVIKSILPVTSIKVNAGNKVDTLNVYGRNNDSEDWTLIYGISVTSTSYQDYSLDIVNKYTQLKLDVAGTQQVRVKSMTLTFAEAATEIECEHTDKVAIGEAKDATCTEAGTTAGLKCANPDCGYIFESQKEIPALGHNYVDGECTVCHTPDPLVSLPGTYYIASKRSSGNYFYMTSDLGDKSTKRYQAVDSGLTELPATIAESETGFVFEIVANGDGTFSVLAVGVEGDNYLGWSSDNSGKLVAQAEAKALTFAPQENGSYHVSFVNGSETRYLQLNNTSGSDYFAFYTSMQARNLFLIPAEAKAVVEMGGKEYTSLTAAYAADPTATIKLLTNVENVKVSGDLYLDLNGFAATNVTATKIYAYDSTATTAQAGTGSLTTTSDVAIDNTANGVRYVALKAEGTYTFHALEMQLTHITLRTTAAGIYYKAKIVCDETLAAAVESYGVALSLNDMPGADFKTEMKDDKNANAWTTVTSALESGKVFTSGSVFNIFKSGADNTSRGEMKIYANAYIQLGDSYIMVDTTSGDTTEAEGFEGTARSLRDVVSQLNDSYSTLSAEDQEKAAKFAKLWSSEMATWEMTTLQQAAEALPDEQPAE